MQLGMDTDAQTCANDIAKMYKNASLEDSTQSIKQLPWKTLIRSI